MKKESILLAIEAVRQSVQEDTHIYLYPSIPEEVLRNHKKSYLDLESDEEVLCLVNKGNKYISMGFSGFCITDKRLIARVENGSILRLASFTRETISIPWEEIGTMEAVENFNNTVRIIVNGQYIGLFYPNETFTELKRNHHKFEIVKALFHEMTRLSAAEETPTVVNYDWAKRYKKSRKSMIGKYWLDPIVHHYCDFKGIASRGEFWYFTLFYCLISLTVEIGLFLLSPTAGSLISCILAFALLLPSLGITVRRLHDAGKKGTMIFVSFIPFIGYIWLLVLLCKKSVNPSPKARTSFTLLDIVVCTVCGVIWLIALFTGMSMLSEPSSYANAYSYNSGYTQSYTPSNTIAASDNTEDEDIAEIKGRVTEIYDKMFAYCINDEYEKENELTKKVFSKELSKLWKKNEEWESKTGMISVDFDIWVMAQYVNNPRMTIDEVVSYTYTKEGHYLVFLTICNDGKAAEHVMLDMVKEKRKWVIDDMEFGNSDYTLRDMLQS